jgi:hypothetical protein
MGKVLALAAIALPMTWFERRWSALALHAWWVGQRRLDHGSFAIGTCRSSTRWIEQLAVGKLPQVWRVQESTQTP